MEIPLPFVDKKTPAFLTEDGRITRGTTSFRRTNVQPHYGIHQCLSL